MNQKIPGSNHAGMKMKTELIWWMGFGLLSTLMIAIVTSFKFGSVDVQLHDTYYVVESFEAIKLLTLIAGIGRYFYLLIDIMTERYPILTLLVSIINPIAGLFVIMGTYLSIETIVTSGKMYPGIDFSVYFLLPGILLALLTVQAIIEVKMLWKLRALLAGE